MNPLCPYGKAALAEKPINDAIDRERERRERELYPDRFDEHGKRRVDV